MGGSEHEKIPLAVREICGAALEAPGQTEPGARLSAFDGGGTSHVAEGFLEKVRTRSFQITATDICTLRDGGISEDAIFELTVAAALGAATARFKARLAAVEAAD